MSDRPPVRIVLDTNILFSAFGWRGAPFECFQAAREDKVELFTCQEILAELKDKLILKLGLTSADSDRAVAEVLSVARLVPLGEIPKVVFEDPDDDAVMACAVVATAELLVSGDRHLLSLVNHEGIEIVTARALLDRLETG